MRALLTHRPYRDGGLPFKNYLVPEMHADMDVGTRATQEQLPRSSFMKLRRGVVSVGKFVILSYRGCPVKFVAELHADMDVGTSETREQLPRSCFRHLRRVVSQLVGCSCSGCTSKRCLWGLVL